jgi:hypothetical protein
MRHLRMALGLVVAVCAFSLAAGPALAHNFTASRLPKPLSEAEPGKTKGFGIASEGLEAERNQFFKFGPFEILCTATAHANTIEEGAVSWSTHQTFSTEIKFQKCLTKAHFGTFTGGLATSFNVNPETKKAEPIKFVYHVNGFAEIGTGETVSEVEVGSGEANFKISGKICKINWPRQTVPAVAEKKPSEEFSAAVYSNNFVPVEETLANKNKFPSGFQQKLVITNAFKNMAWKLEEGQCAGEGGFEEEAKTLEAKTGLYKGAIEEMVIGGNLGFE